MLEEFKKFALRGNAVDLAIGVIIGAAFGAIVNSVVGDILSPIIGAVTGGPRFFKLLSAVVVEGDGRLVGRGQETGRRARMGSFITFVINFVIIAAILFLVVKLMNRLMQSEAEKTPAPTKQEVLLTEIRDLLKDERK